MGLMGVVGWWWWCGRGIVGASGAGIVRICVVVLVVEDNEGWGSGGVVGMGMVVGIG